MKPVHEEPEYPGLKKEAEEKDKKENETKPVEEKTTNKTENAEKDKKPTIITLKEPIKAKETKFGSLPLEGEKLVISHSK